MSDLGSEPTSTGGDRPLLDVRELSKAFGGLQAVSKCSLVIHEKTVVGLIGPNGAGKSTVIDLVSGFGRPDEGSIRFDGHDLVGKRPDVISRLGLIRTFQTPREWAGLTVMDNVLLGCRQMQRESLRGSLIHARRVRREEEGDRLVARGLLERYRLDQVKNDRAGSLSGGQKRLLEFARIAAASPRLAILDEPMGGVNPVLGERIKEAVRDLAASGTTVLVVEHNLPFIEQTCDDVIVMDQGEVIAQGPFDSLRSNERVVDAYLGMDQSHA